ncbi:hypothetical protein [Shimia marina]|uniref:Uncharacterized protein n=1 Tax=Shimia marina TaxID=321267 RepID=A0A0P1ET54_9RHOB|nr:hypothetical protein [Shimia marina]CUH53727.1 hypothetical protein SHM7688_03187 [Shimia marina]SFD69928.1 hypothetical protein SAMN04488037_10283 [Shimia marina]
METIHALMQQSAGVGAGIALGSAVGFGLRRKRSGSSEGLIGGSVFVTSAVCGIVAMGVMMLITYVSA